MQPNPKLRKTDFINRLYIIAFKIKLLFHNITEIYLGIDRTYVIFLKLFTNFPYPQIMISNMNYKIRKFLFIHPSRFTLFAHLTSIMLEIKGVKHSAKTASSCSNQKIFMIIQYKLSRHQTKLTNHSKKEGKFFHEIK